MKAGYKIVFFVLLVLDGQVFGAKEISAQLITLNVQDKASLQRGAKLFMNYCSGCHSLKYVRYNRMAEDLGLTTRDGQVDWDLLKRNLIFTQASPVDSIQIAMPVQDAKRWFGRVPPDLSLSARERGAIWLYRYLKSFYSDSTRPFGVNNLLIPNTAMPNILETMRGNMNIAEMEGFHSALVEEGKLSQNQLDGTVQDLVTFLVYVGEPAQLVRYHIGLFVIVFLLIFVVIAYLLKRVYWKQIVNSK